MPFSSHELDGWVVKFVFDNIPQSCEIVDVGPGAGKYFDLLGNQYRMVAIEPFSDYNEIFKLAKKYKIVIQKKAIDVEWSQFSGRWAILGDVLEHMTVSEAQKLLHNMREHVEGILVVVPFEYEQGPNHPDVLAWHNPHEVHLQPDLTRELMKERYPELGLVTASQTMGFYVWKREARAQE